MFSLTFGKTVFRLMNDNERNVTLLAAISLWDMLMAVQKANSCA